MEAATKLTRRKLDELKLIICISFIVSLFDRHSAVLIGWDFARRPGRKAEIIFDPGVQRVQGRSATHTSSDRRLRTGNNKNYKYPISIGYLKSGGHDGKHYDGLVTCIFTLGLKDSES